MLSVVWVAQFGRPLGIVARLLKLMRCWKLELFETILNGNRDREISGALIVSGSERLTFKDSRVEPLGS